MNAQPAVPFDEYYVAFLDILGFSNLVKQAIESGGDELVSRLFSCHQQGASMIASDPRASIVQFSDSIVISRPFDSSKFGEFISIVSGYQKMLIKGGFLCRGGISRGRHFSNGYFMVSAGLVQAYSVEQKHARYPRIVVSPELISLLSEKTQQAKQKLCIEDDGLVFVNFLAGGRKKERVQIVDALKNRIAECLNDQSTSVREKGVWLAAFLDAIEGTRLSPTRFKAF